MKEMISISPGELGTGELHTYLLGSIGPRPIAFASTLDEKGRPNLSPFSFFNVFSTKPPILIFSPSRRGRDNSTKHTLENVLATKEVVINMVNFDMVQQMSLASTEYAKGVNEFKKAGLTMLPSELVKPFRVAESPVQIECKVIKVEALGKQGGAGNLVFSEVLKMHIDPSILNEQGGIDPYKIDLVARMGGNWYSRAKQGLFEVPKPLTALGIGIDHIPLHILQSKILSGNDLGKLGNVESIPTQDEVDEFVNANIGLRSLISGGERSALEHKAKDYLSRNDVLSAWKVLLAE